MKTRAEIKVELRDWMTQVIQLTKVSAPKMSAETIADGLNANIEGLKLNEKWVLRALYGHESKIPGKNK